MNGSVFCCREPHEIDLNEQDRIRSFAERVREYRYEREELVIVGVLMISLEPLLSRDYFLCLAYQVSARKAHTPSSQQSVTAVSVASVGRSQDH